jgi:site-specific recombinase XerD
VRKKKTPRQERAARQRTIAALVEAYIGDHIGGNSSDKTIEWHRTSLGFLRQFLEEQVQITEIEEVEADDMSAWFAYLRSTPGARGKARSERTIQTYARSARAFFHWLVRRGTLEQNPFDRVVFPKVGRPLIQTITDEEFEQLLLACAPPNETGPLAERATVRNRAILWLLYDTGIRVSELINLRVGDLDRKKGTITVLGKGSKERRLALGQNCLRNLSYRVSRHRLFLRIENGKTNGWKEAMMMWLSPPTSVKKERTKCYGVRANIAPSSAEKEACPAQATRPGD